MQIEFYILSERWSYVQRHESSEFEMTYKDKIQLENAGIRTLIIVTDKSYMGIIVA